MESLTHLPQAMDSSLTVQLIRAMSWQQAILIGATVLAVYLTISTIISYRRLAHIKGPLIAAWTPLWLGYHTIKGDVYAAAADLLKQYGSPVRIAPNIVVMDDPESMRTITAPKSTWWRGHWFEGLKFDPRVDNVMSLRSKTAHGEMRRKLIPGYSGNDVPTLELDIDDRVVELKNLISTISAKKQVFDMALTAHFFTLDVLTKIGFGEPVGFLTKNEDVYDFIHNSEAFFPVMEIASNHPIVLSIMRSPLFSAFQPKDTDKLGLGAILGLARKTVNDRLKPDAEERADVLGSFIKHGLNRTELQSETVLLLLGGSDSTATALRNTLVHLLSSPRVYTTLQKEIDEAVAQGKATSPVITNSEAQALPYLQAVMKEGLRIFMPLVGLAGREPPKGGAVLNDVFYPEGTQLGLSTYAMLRRPDLFGADADTFRPERWLEADKETLKAMERNHSLVFGAGITSCLGKSIAQMELRKALFELLRSFDLVLVNPIKPINIRANGVVVQKDMLVRANAREAKE